MAAGAAVALSRQGRRGTLSDADAAAPRHRRLLRRRAAAKGGAMSDLFVLRPALPRDADDIARVHVETWQSTRSEEHTSELQSLMRISYAVFCLQKKKSHLVSPHTNETNTKFTTPIYRI